MSICDRCKNKCKIDVIEIESCINFVGEAPHKIVTNFDRITASPESLAKWVCEIADFCDRGCSHCPVQEKCLYDSDGAGNKDNDELLLEWLNEESEE